VIRESETNTRSHKAICGSSYSFTLWLDMAQHKACRNTRTVGYIDTVPRTYPTLPDERLPVLHTLTVAAPPVLRWQWLVRTLCCQTSNAWEQAKCWMGANVKQVTDVADTSYRLHCFVFHVTWQSVSAFKLDDSLINSKYNYAYFLLLTWNTLLYDFHFEIKSETRMQQTSLNRLTQWDFRFGQFKDDSVLGHSVV
jgi:hypothetical protein